MILNRCRLVDVESGQVRENASIHVEGGVIKNIQDGGTIDEKEGIDLNGLYVLPGLFNAHVHLSMVFPFSETDLNEEPAITSLRCYRRASDALRAGVTTIRTVGEQHRADIALRTMINKDWVNGARIISAGKAISVSGGHGLAPGPSLATEANGADGFRKAARTELASGANHIKIFLTGGLGKIHEKLAEKQATRDEIKAAVSVASSKGTYVCAHAGDSEPIIQAVEAGIRCFEHCYNLNDQAANSIRESNGYAVPTLVVTRSPDWMRANRFEEWTIEKAVGAGSTHLESIRTAVRAGVKIVNGTDMPPGDTNNGVNATVREAEFLVDAGLSPLDALRASTINAAQLCNIDDQLGLVKPGYQADLIATQDNPLDNIQNLRHIKYVMHSGRVVRNEINRSG